MKSRLKKFWKRWNEYFMFIFSLALFYIWPFLYRIMDATAGAFDTGILHVIPTGLLIANLIFAASWANHRMTWELLNKWFDNDLEINVLSNKNVFASKFSMQVYFGYVAVYTIIYAVLI